MLKYCKIFSQLCGTRLQSSFLSHCIRGLSTSKTCLSQGAPVTSLPEITEKYPHLKTHKDIYEFSLENVSYDINATFCFFVFSVFLFYFLNIKSLHIKCQKCHIYLLHFYCVGAFIFTFNCECCCFVD